MQHAAAEDPVTAPGDARPAGPWSPAEALAAFERAVLTCIVERPGGPDAGGAQQALERAWDALRDALGLARLELHADLGLHAALGLGGAAGGGVHPGRGDGTRGLVAPARAARRLDVPWLARLAPEVGASRAAGAGPLAGLDVATYARRGPEGLLVAQGPPEALPSDPLAVAVARAGAAAVALGRARAGAARLAALARIGARAGGRLHDLRNQLTLAMFRADLGAMGGDEPRALAARRALVEDLRLARELAADGLALGRGISPRTAEVPEDLRPLRKVGLRALLLEEARALAATARAAGARVRARCPIDLEALGDSTALGRLVRNLLLNAAESRGGGAAITVDATRIGTARLALSIADDGRGMDAAELAAYFDAGRCDAGGTGFGTASVRDTLEALDGALAIASAPGAGTRVTLELWAAPESGACPALVVAPRGVLAAAAGDTGSEGVVVASPLRALALLEGLAPRRLELHRAALGPGRRQLLRAAARLGVPVAGPSARDAVALP